MIQAHWVSLNLSVLDFKFLNVTAVTGFAMLLDFPGGSDGKESACNAGDPGSIPGAGRSPGGGHGHPLQYSWASLLAQMVKNLPATQELQ